MNAGATVHYEVSKVGFTTQEGDIETKSSDGGKAVTKDITLVAVEG